MGMMNSKFRKVAPASVERRTSNRHAISARCMSIARPDQKPKDAELGDLSKYGCRLIASENYNVGDNVLLGFLDAAPISAVVIWCENSRLGCRFDHELNPQLFRQLTLQTA